LWCKPLSSHLMSAFRFRGRRDHCCGKHNLIRPFLADDRLHSRMGDGAIGCHANQVRNPTREEMMAGPVGFEPSTYSLGGCRSIRTELRARIQGLSNHQYTVLLSTNRRQSRWNLRSSSFPSASKAASSSFIAPIEPVLSTCACGQQLASQSGILTIFSSVQACGAGERS
jgi:hypothetical protein